MRQKIRKIAIFFIVFYQKTLSLDKGFLKKYGLVNKQICVFYPNCSDYTIQAIDKYGIRKGVFLGFLRILKCHPWQKNHLDPLK